MPIKIPDTLPAYGVLESENIFVMSEKRAATQDIRPLKIVILNLMPTKITTETQLMRLLSNSPLQIEITLLKTSSHESKNTSKEHLSAFYHTFSEIKQQKFDGMVITGAPVEDMDFERVDYWEELCEIMEWSKNNVYSCFHICWGAQAALYYHYGIKKHPLDQKLFGVFRHKVLIPSHPLLRGFNEYFYAPHSRHSTVLTEDIEACPALDILAHSEKTGVYIAASHDMRRIFVTGHSEYDFDTLKNEYLRDKAKSYEIALPENYFPDNNPDNEPVNFWRSHAHLLYSNWLNYFVYQRTPFEITDIN